MKKLITLILAAALCLSVLTGCGKTESGKTESGESTQTEAPRTLKIALSGQPETLDVTMTSVDIASEVVYGSVFEKLVAFDGQNTIIPELAESWTVSDENRVYTYTLRHGVRFHNGEEMKAADVAASMNRWIDAADNARTLTGGAHFSVVDDYTVEIRMEAGTLYLNEMIAGLGQQAAIMPASVLAGVGEGELLHDYVGTGPYRFDEWRADQYIRLKANEDYSPYGTQGDYSGWGGYKTAWYDEVYFYFPGDNATVVSGVLTGEFDLADSVDSDNRAKFDGNEDYSILSSEQDLQMLIFNKSQGVASNAKVRQAVQAVINCDDVLYASFGDPSLYSLDSSYMFQNVPTWYTEAGSEYYNQNDPERAAALFEEAGWKEGDVFRILIRSNSSVAYAQAQVIQEELRGIQIDCEILSYDSATYSEVRNNHPEDWDAFLTSFSNKPLPNMNLFLSASWAGWCADERIQGDLGAIAAETDLDAARQIWSELQQYMYEEFVPVVKFGTTQACGVSVSSVEGALIKERLVWVNAHPAV